MLSIFQPIYRSLHLNDIFGDIFGGIENWCMIFNELFILFFTYVRYIFAIILLIIAFMTIFRYRGIYLLEKLRTQYKNYIEPDFKDKVKQSHVILGMVYLCMSVGILTGYFTHFLIWVLDPLPDRFVFQFINFSDMIDPNYLNRITDINAALYPHEKTIYFVFSFASFVALVQIFVCIWTIINTDAYIGNPTKLFLLLFSGVIEGLFFGFTTCLPFFL
jgi:hypothetical protein